MPFVGTVRLDFLYGLSFSARGAALRQRITALASGVIGDLGGAPLLWIKRPASWGKQRVPI